MKTEYLNEDLTLLANYIEQYNLGNSTILITGATGLIGSLLVKSFIEHNRTSSNPINIIALARSKEKVSEIFGETNGVEFVYQDICEELFFKYECDYIIHTANPTTSQYFITNPVETLDSIYTGTKNVLEYAKKVNIKGMVYLSSMEVFGVVNSEQRIKEEELGYIDIQNIRSSYSEGKRVAELMCKLYANEYSVPVRIARLAQTFGPGININENRVFAQFARNAIKGEDIVLHTKGESFGNYCYTRDTLKAIILLLNKGMNGEAYTVVNEDNTTTIANMAKMVAEKVSNGKSKVISDIPNDNQYGYAPDTHIKLSSEKLRKLGWTPEVNLEDMFIRMLEDLD